MSSEKLSEETEVNLIRLMLEHDGEPAGDIDLDSFEPMPEEQYQALRKVIHENADKIMVQTLVKALKSRDRELVQLKLRADRTMKRMMDWKEVPPEVVTKEREYVPTRGVKPRDHHSHGKRAIAKADVVSEYAKEVGMEPGCTVAEEIAKFYAWLRP